jgi:carbamoyl-phosphate synthase (ammonia)
MVGYPENLTDPSYRGQILCTTFPLVGNYGVPERRYDEFGLDANFESDRIHIRGLIVSDYSHHYSHWNATRSLSQWMEAEGVPGLYGVDTRALTQRLRTKGALMGKIVPEGSEEQIFFYNPNATNLVREVSAQRPVTYGSVGPRILAVDCGMKSNIVRQLARRGCQVRVVPYDHPFGDEVDSFDGLFLSNGPGDPGMCQTTVANIRKVMDADHAKPIFGICLGNQLMALAAGAETYKLPFGNRGQNQPVIDTETGRCYITPQNHGFAVKQSTLPGDWKQLFYNANDHSNEGIQHVSRPWFSAQFHPEAKGGPYDTGFLFDKFLGNVRTYVKTREEAAAAAAAGGGPGGSGPSGRSKPKKVLILGSGGLSIGQAGEFDYSGSQAIKALKEEGIASVLVNPNIATVQTAKDLADKTYFLPVTPDFVTDVIAKERPDGLFLAFGGQTALNCGVELDRRGVLKEYGVKVLGTPVQTIIDTEDRELFNRKLDEINIRTAVSETHDTVEGALKAAEKIGYPVMIRCAFALGGLGSGICADARELTAMTTKALASAPQVLIERSMKGWKEVEYEVVRDSFDNCITTCNMENFDPMGIHTGESIVVAPSQTLTNSEYHMLREHAIAIVRHLGVIGECNVQYSLHPGSEEYSVIEVNARLSRSSALASKATGYPLAFIAAKLSIGHDLPTLRNSITRTTSACFEPSLDYCVIKVPRWDLRKFTRVSPLIGSAMKSVGEVMAIGRSFEEAFQKALRMVNPWIKGFESHGAKYFPTLEDCSREIANPTDMRPFAIARALELGMTVDQIHDLSKIDRWFLQKLRTMDGIGRDLGSAGGLKALPVDLLQLAKKAGFSDRQIGERVGSSELEVRAHRKAAGVLPVVKQIDTLAAEYPAQTNYLYVSYHGTEHDVTFDGPDAGKAHLVLGSGVYRIGSSVEFDYCGVTAARTLRRLGHKTIIVNYNPETVSTDYDESDRLYFEELSLERILDITDNERPAGVVVSMGGQTPNNLALPLARAGVPVLGTSPEDIDRAEDRKKFSAMLDELGVDQPAWAELSTVAEAAQFASKVGYPVLVRPSYVLSGAAMSVIRREQDLEHLLKEAADVSPDHPVVISKFHEGFRELDFDAVANRGNVLVSAVSEHVENAGVHSGDATMLLPAQSVPRPILARFADIGAMVARGLNISGPMNMQLLWDGKDVIKVIECNVRASRSFPFVSKVYDVDFIDLAMRVMLNHPSVPKDPITLPEVDHVACKAPQFSWQRVQGADPVLGVEMASTGEVACFGRDAEHAFLKALIASRFTLPKSSVYVNCSATSLPLFVESARTLDRMGYKIFACPETARGFSAAGIKAEALPDYVAADISVAFNLASDTRGTAIQHVKEKKIDLVLNLDDRRESYPLRRTAVDFGVPLLTNLQLANMLVRSLDKTSDFAITAWNDYFPKPGSRKEKETYSTRPVVKPQPKN